MGKLKIERGCETRKRPIDQEKKKGGGGGRMRECDIEREERQSERERRGRKMQINKHAGTGGIN